MSDKNEFIMKLVYQGLRINGETVKASEVIGNASESEVRATLAMIIGRYE